MTIKPLPGKCIIRIEQNWKAVEGGIILPDTCKVPGYVGVVVAHNPRHGDNLTGKRVTIERHVGQMFIGADKNDYIAMRDDQILSIIPDGTDAKIEAAPMSIQRCRSCKSKGEGNLLLDNAGFCINCGKNAKGEKRPTDRVKVSDQEFDQFNLLPNVQNVRQRRK